jgi:hypothetical protein
VNRETQTRGEVCGFIKANINRAGLKVEIVGESFGQEPLFGGCVFNTSHHDY